MKCIVALAALAATSLAATGSSSSSNSACSKKITVKGQSEINTINSCSKFNSDVVIDGISGITAISMDNVEQINGELIIQNMFQLETISLGQLTYAKGFKVVNNTQVYKVAIPKLSNVDGDFQIIVNPNLKELQANITK
ncbi:protoplasts-secreted, partial [Dipsacomyces acuminosporus]